jgi:hypothetical protein
VSISNYAELKLLDTLGNTSFAVATAYVKLHLGDPGEDGTSQPAAETSRKLVSWSAASAGAKSSSAVLSWTNVSTTETYTHWSMWDASTAGNCLWSGALSASASVTAGDTFEITSLTLTLD